MSASPQPYSSSTAPPPQPSIAVTSSSPSNQGASGTAPATQSHNSGNYPATTAATNSLPSDSPAHLATLLANAYLETDSLKHELAATKKRAEKAERIAANLSASSPPAANGPDSQHSTVPSLKVIQDYEARIDRAENAKEDAEARLLAIYNAWTQLDRYLASSEHRTSDARAAFSRLLDDRSTRPVFPVTVRGLPDHLQPFQLSPPASSRAPSSRTPAHVSSSSFPQLPLPPPLTGSSRRVRRRSGSLDAVVPPPSKRPRGDRDREVDIRSEQHLVRHL